jgi:hypothetical protein
MLVTICNTYLGITIQNSQTPCYNRQLRIFRYYAKDVRKESETETWREQSAHKTNNVAGTLSIHVTGWRQLRMQGRLLAHAQYSHVDSRTSYHLHFIQLRRPQGAMYFYASNEHAAAGRRIRGVVKKFPDWWLKTHKGLPFTLGAGITFKVVPLLRLDNDPSGAARVASHTMRTTH